MLRSVADMFLPADIFCKQLRMLPSLYSELRNFLDGSGANMVQHSSQRIMMTLAHNIYEQQEDRHAAISIVQNTIASGRRSHEQIDTSQSTRLVPAATASARPRGSSVDKIAHIVAMRLRDKDKKFSGAIWECWMEYVDEYKQVAIDYSLGPTQRPQYMHNLLSGDAKRFFLDKVEGYRIVTLRTSTKLLESWRKSTNRLCARPR